MASIVLEPEQEQNVSTIMEILNTHSIAHDFSIAGAGKTPMAARVCHLRGVQRIIIVCYNSLQVDHWTRHCTLFNIPVSLILTYDMLRGTKTTVIDNGIPVLPHRLLLKDNYGFYHPTDLFKMWVEDGLALIADECHSLKNRCGKNHAFAALSKYITLRNLWYPITGIKSYTYFMSMTPFDKEEHCINLALTCGIIPCEPLFDSQNKRAYGLEYLYNYCKAIDTVKTQKIWGMYEITEKNAFEISYRLIVEVFLRKTSSFTKNTNLGYTSKQSVYYSSFTVTNDCHNLMKAALNMIKSRRDENLEEILISDIDTEQVITEQQTDQESYLFSQIVNFKGTPLRERNGVIQGTITVQTIKSYFIVLGLVNEILNQIPNSKIVIFLNYKESINIVMKYLAHLNPVKITGDVECTKEKRNEIIAKFNEPNLESRILVIIAQIGSDSIELDDKYGNYPRVGIAFPDFYYSKYFQCPGRLFRRYTKSNSLFFFCLVNSNEYSEESIEKSLIEKSKVMEETLQNNEIIPPSNYLKITDPHLHGLNNLLLSAGTVLPERSNSILNVINPVQSVKIPSLIKRF